MALLTIFVALVGFITGILSREIKTFKSLPAISNSLVNFGKMDFSFYLGDKYKGKFILYINIFFRIIASDLKWKILQTS